MAKAPTLNKPEPNISGSEVVSLAPVEKEAKPVHPADADMNAIERENHQRAKDLANNVPLSGKSAEDEKEQRAFAQARMDKLKTAAPLSNADELEARPSSWSIVNNGGGNITATNRYTGKVYEGPIANFLKK